MAQKVWIGKSNHSNIGNTGNKYGLWITRKDMASCTKDEINLNTDTFGNASGAIDVGQFQVIPTSGTTASQQVSISASGSAIQDYWYPTIAAWRGVNNLGALPYFYDHVFGINDPSDLFGIAPFTNYGGSDSQAIPPEAVDNYNILIRKYISRQI